MKRKRLFLLMVVILIFACSHIPTPRHRIAYDPVLEYVSKINELFEQGTGHCRLNSLDRSAILTFEHKNIGFLQVQVSKSGRVDFYLADVFKEEENISPGAIFYVREVSGKVTGLWMPTNGKKPAFQPVQKYSFSHLALIYHKIKEFVNEGYEKYSDVKEVSIAVKGADIRGGFFSTQ